jgi:hypothetical protein
MDLNLYALEVLSREHLAELRADAERQDRVRRVTRAAPLRVVLGLALIRAGSWTLGSAHRSLALRLF